MACSGQCWNSAFLGYVLWSFTTITEGAGGRCHDIVIGGGMPHSDHEWGEGAWLGGYGLQWSVLELYAFS